jgi:hypothetical protein
MRRLEKTLASKPPIVDETNMIGPAKMRQIAPSHFTATETAIVIHTEINGRKNQSCHETSPEALRKY